METHYHIMHKKMPMYYIIIFGSAIATGFFFCIVLTVFIVGLFYCFSLFLLLLFCGWLPLCCIVYSWHHCACVCLYSEYMWQLNSGEKFFFEKKKQKNNKKTMEKTKIK